MQIAVCNTIDPSFIKINIIGIPIISNLLFYLYSNYIPIKLYMKQEDHNKVLAARYGINFNRSSPITIYDARVESHTYFSSFNHHECTFYIEDTLEGQTWIKNHAIWKLKN